ncbi:MAG: hypothetical protein NC409_11950 [Clostridium sp.]|nr:hypothetical protein [Clostridium sp.]
MGLQRQGRSVHPMDGNVTKYYTAGHTIFVHAGIDEEAGDLWEWETGDEIFVGKYPAETGNWLILPYDEENE